MPISKTLTKALETQVGLEFLASSTYLQAASLARSVGCVKLHALYLRNAGEEREHGDGIVVFLDRRGVVASIPAVEAPPVSKDLGGALKAVLALEERVTAALTAIQLQAEAEKDRQAYAFLMPYLSEQTEGEDQARQVLAFFEAAGDVATFDQQVAALM